MKPPHAFWRAGKNGGVLGEEIFCPRAVAVFYAVPTAWHYPASGIFDKVGSSGIV